MSISPLRMLWLTAFVALASACGPTELPAFANPPPYDAGSQEADAGPSADR